MAGPICGAYCQCIYHLANYCQTSLRPARTSRVHSPVLRGPAEGLKGTGDPTPSPEGAGILWRGCTVRPIQGWRSGEGDVSNGYSMRLVQRDKAGGLVLTPPMGSWGRSWMVPSVAHGSQPDSEDNSWGMPRVCRQGIRARHATTIAQTWPVCRRRGCVRASRPVLPRVHTWSAIDPPAGRARCL